MSTRIRYVTNPDGTLESMQVFKAHTGGAEYKCLISTDGREGYVLTKPDNTIKIKVTASSAHKTKIALKAALKTLTVVFLNEKRQIDRSRTTEDTGTGSLQG